MTPWTRAGRWEGAVSRLSRKLRVVLSEGERIADFARLSTQESFDPRDKG